MAYSPSVGFIYGMTVCAYVCVNFFHAVLPSQTEMAP